MTRSILCGLLSILSVGALVTIPAACTSGGIGDPCTPEDEYRADFPGFKVQQENIESRSFQCSTRICLVNHFQGRVSCPRGQTLSDITPCNGPDDNSSCSGIKGAKCVEAQTLAPECTPCKAGDNDCATKNDCAGLPGTTCDDKRKICQCQPGGIPGPEGFYCSADKTFKSYVCHVEGECQSGAVDADGNKGKQCCIPGTDTPVAVPVCGQCDAKSFRDAENAVYCSCRCLRDGETGDPNFNYCTCPTGFTCNEIRRNVGLGDAQLTGSYCIKENSAFDPNKPTCGTVVGNATPGDCEGSAAGTLTSDGGT